MLRTSSAYSLRQLRLSHVPPPSGQLHSQVRGKRSVLITGLRLVTLECVSDLIGASFDLVN